MRHIMPLAMLGLLAACSGGDKKEPTQRDQIGQVWKYETAGASQKVAYIGSANSVDERQCKRSKGKARERVHKITLSVSNRRWQHPVREHCSCCSALAIFEQGSCSKSEQRGW